MGKKYKILSEETIKNLIDFLDEIQFDAAKEGTTEDMQKVNFCNFIIGELLNAQNIIDINDSKKKKKKKSRDDIIDEHFIDWVLPDMTDTEFEKLIENFDNFLKGWEKEYNKKSKNNKSDKSEDKSDKNNKRKKFIETCSLDEIRDMLLDDPELTDHERFDLYYEEWDRVQKEKIPSYTLDELLKGTKIIRSKNKK